MPITLAGLHVYPVKGLKGIDLAEARCTNRGIEHDRRWMLVDCDGVFMTQRTHPRMATVWTDLHGGALTLSAADDDGVEVPLSPPADAKPLRVQVWSSTCDAVTVSPAADRWLSEYLGVQCRLVHMPDESKRFSNAQYGGGGHRVGFADGFAYLLANQASLADLNRRLGERNHSALPMNRFRPNLVVAGGDAFAEDRWGEIRIGEATLRSVKPCGRCEVTTTDQSTGEVRGPEPLATLATFRNNPEIGVMFGINLVAVRSGTVRVGDIVGVS